MCISWCADQIGFPSSVDSTQENTACPNSVVSTQADIDFRSSGYSIHENVCFASSVDCAQKNIGSPSSVDSTQSIRFFL